MLPALGFPSRTIQRAFLTEGTFVALEGILLGTALSILTSYLLVKNDDQLTAAGVGFPVPWTSIAIRRLVAAAGPLLVPPRRQRNRVVMAIAGFLIARDAAARLW